jgi:hypothetical protein
MYVIRGLFSQFILFETDGSNYYRYAAATRQLRFGRNCNGAVKRYQCLGRECSKCILWTTPITLYLKKFRMNGVNIQ